MRCCSRVLLAALLSLLFAAGANSQQTNESQFILRAPAASVPAICQRYGLEVVRQLGRSDRFLVKPSYWMDPEDLLELVREDPEVRHFEVDKSGRVPEKHDDRHAPLSQSTAAILEAISDPRLTDFFGDAVWVGYVSQPATQILGLTELRAKKYRGRNDVVVAVIDTGVDPNHPVLRRWLVPGYDFTRDVAGTASEWPDLDPLTAATLQQSTAPILEHSTLVTLSQSTAPILEKSVAATLQSGQLPQTFGHGTLVAGLIHLAAPKAKIMPLKVFRADGTVQTSDIIRAIYYAVDNGARVINMSFTMEHYSGELMVAINYATRNGVICVAAVGNQSQRRTLVYPAVLQNVISVASTTNLDTRAELSNYGVDLVKVAAPGEALISTYPGGGYAAVWGTSFSAALVSGGAALFLDVDLRVDQDAALKAFAQGGVPLGEELGYGRVDIKKAILFLRKLGWLADDDDD